MSGGIYISGVGLRAKYGDTLHEFWEALNTPNNYSSQDIYTSILSNELYHEDYEDYLLNMCVSAINSAAQDSGIQMSDSSGCVIIGTGMGLSDSFLHTQTLNRNYMSQFKVKIQERLDSNINVIIIANACCAGAQAIAYGYDLLKSKKYSYVIAGGAEEFSCITYAGFKRLNCIDESGCKPFDKKRKGIYIGDGAAFFVLQKEKPYHNYCTLLGHVVTNDAFHVVSLEPDGIQIKKAIYGVLRRAGIKENEIDAVITHGTGTKLNDSIEAKVLNEIFGRVDITAPKGKIGHTGGASGAFGVLAALCMLKYQQIPPIINTDEPDEEVKVEVAVQKHKNKKISNLLVDCFAFGGTNTVLLCGKVNRNNYIIHKRVVVSDNEFKNSNFSPTSKRTMDKFTRKIIYTANKLFEGNLNDINPECTGAVISTRTGAFSSLKETANIIRDYGYKGINPSLFPNVMLSTALSYLTIYCKIHGPSCTFYDIDIQAKDAMEYCEVQINENNCDAMIMISVDENGWSVGQYIIRKGHINEGCTN